MEQSDQDRIRARRLERLGGAAASSSSASGSGAGAGQQSEQGAAAGPSSSQQSQRSQAGSSSAAAAAAAARKLSPVVTSSSSSSVAPTPTTSAPAPTPKATPKPTPKPTTASARSPPPPSSSRAAEQKPSETFEDTPAQWADRMLENILRVTLRRSKAEQSNWQVSWLKDVAEETGESNHALSADLIDRCLLARLDLSGASMTDDAELATVLAALPASQTPFEYLAGCWKRERVARASLVARKPHLRPDVRDGDEYKQRVAVLDEIRRLTTAYMRLALTDPSVFPAAECIEPTRIPQPGPRELLPVALSGTAASPPTQPLRAPIELHTLLDDLSNSGDDDDDGAFALIARALVEDLVRVTASCDIGGEPYRGPPEVGTILWRDALLALQGVLAVKPVARAIAANDNLRFDPATVSAREIEHVALLGPVLRLSTFPDASPALAKRYFEKPSQRPRGDVTSAQASLRSTLAILQRMHFQLLEMIVRAGPEPRERTLGFIAHALALNSRRAAMRVDPRQVASHGFVVNLHCALLRFAEPFMDVRYSKIDKIDPAYYRRSKRIDIKEETKMNATQQESDEYYSSSMDVDEQAPNFISDVFFLATLAMHLGPLTVVRDYKSLKDSMRHYRRQADELEADAGEDARLRQQVTAMRARLDDLEAQQCATEVQLHDDDYARRCVQFCTLEMAWLVRLVDPRHQHPHTQVSLPLSEETPTAFRFLPEYLMEDLTSYLQHLSRHLPHVLAESSMDELVTFMLVFLSTPYVHNPYLKGQFVEIMYNMCNPMPGHPQGAIGDVLNLHPLAIRHLVPCLVHAYIEIETTGSHTQFYDKFNTRFYIAQLFRLIGQNPGHLDALKDLAKTDLERFVRFVNLMMNDTTYLLDDLLNTLAKISECQKQMDNKAEWDAMSPEDRQETEKKLSQYENVIKSDIQLGTVSLRFIHFFTSRAKRPFLAPEIVDRLAAMLDYNIFMLAGPRCQDLKVRDPEKLGFKPKTLLADVINIFLALGREDEFQHAVAKDGRSYSKDLFDRAGKIALRTSIKTESELEPMRELVKRVEEIRATEQEDDAMGDIPEEFLDPLTYDLMRDPVILPTSKTVIDRSTIKQHHLSDQTDPFNRMPLKWEDIQDAPEIKQQIDAFIADRRSKRKGAVAAVEEALGSGPEGGRQVSAEDVPGGPA